jgi:hypothetical protein
MGILTNGKKNVEIL